MTTPPPPRENLDPLAAAKRRVAAAADVCAAVQVALDAFRTYDEGHQAIAAFQDALAQKVAAFGAEFDDLALYVTPRGLSVDGKVVSGEKTDGFGLPMFLDGVQALVLPRGDLGGELPRLLAILRACLDGEKGHVHSFATRFWEADFQRIRVVMADTFADGGDAADGGTAASPDSFSVEDGVKALLSTLGGERLAGGSAADAGEAAGVLVLTRDDEEVLRMDAVADVTAEDLARQEAARRAAVTGLSDEEAGALRAGIERAERGGLARLLVLATSLDPAGTALPAGDRARLEAFLGDALEELAAAGAWEDLEVCLRAGATAASSVPHEAPARLAALQRLLRRLDEPRVLEMIRRGVDGGASPDAALRIARYVPSRGAALLLQWLPRMDDPAGVDRVGRALLPLRPSAAQLSAALDQARGEAALRVLALPRALDDETRWAVGLAGLHHPEDAVRAAAFKGLDRARLAERRGDLLDLLDSGDAFIRRALQAAFVGARDARVAPFLARDLANRALDADERRGLVAALVNVGGPAALRALRDLLADEKDDADLRALAALALGQAGDEGARAALDREAQRLLGGPLKKAAAEALKRLDARRTK